ncbi:membrane hypothetical protein [Vibrio crassostreae]|nr:membrane hypothetical protein [Vibrio crassostreae]
MVKANKQLFKKALAMGYSEGARASEGGHLVDTDKAAEDLFQEFVKEQEKEQEARTVQNKDSKQSKVYLFFVHLAVGMFYRKSCRQHLFPVLGFMALGGIGSLLMGFSTAFLGFSVTTDLPGWVDAIANVISNFIDYEKVAWIFFTFLMLFVFDLFSHHLRKNQTLRKDIQDFPIRTNNAWVFMGNALSTVLKAMTGVVTLLVLSYYLINLVSEEQASQFGVDPQFAMNGVYFILFDLVVWILLKLRKDMGYV